MPSPFPGVDPFIESAGIWGDFHGGLIADVRRELNVILPPNYAAGMDLYVWFHEPEASRRTRLREPDVYVTREGAAKPQAARGVAIAPPATIRLPEIERRRRRYLKIEDVRSKRVVTVMEILSPSNKEPGDDREAYLAKRSEYFANRVNLVELDLLRGGIRLPLGRPSPAVSDYNVMVCRSWEFPKAGLWSFGMRDPLPDIPIPLDPDVPAVVLSLHSCVQRAYEEGRYALRLNYDRPLTPRLRKRDSIWAAKLLAEREHR